MNPMTQAPLNLSQEELALFNELLESEQARVLVEIRHTAHRSYRDELRHRLDLIESLMQRSRQT